MTTFRDRLAEAIQEWEPKLIEWDAALDLAGELIESGVVADPAEVERLTAQRDRARKNMGHIARQLAESEQRRVDAEATVAAAHAIVGTNALLGSQVCDDLRAALAADTDPRADAWDEAIETAIALAGPDAEERIERATNPYRARAGGHDQ